VETTEEKELDDELFLKRFITSGCGRGASFYSAADIQQAKVESEVTISSAEIFSLVKEFQHRSPAFRATGGVHSTALCDVKSILLFSEDIGRHNAVDKIFGRCILQGIPTDNHIIVTSGRISSEILFKVARRNIPVLVSISAPTNLGVKLASDLGITLVGFVRGEKMNAYASSWRITVDKQA
jgi:FdhD protein